MAAITDTAPKKAALRGVIPVNSSLGKGLRAWGASTALAAALLVTPALASEWRAIPELEISETYTDNVDLTPTNRQWDLVTRITPGVTVTGRSGRTKLDLTYRLNFLVFAKSDEDTDVRHFLSANGTSELVDDLLFLDVRGSVNQQFQDIGGAVSGNQDNATDNRRTVQNYSVSPYIRRDLGSFATATLRYRAGYVEVGGGPPANPLLADFLSTAWTHQATLQLDGGRRFGRLGWSAVAQHDWDERKAPRRDSESATYRLNTDYQMSDWLTLLATVGYDNVDDTSLISDRDGVSWNLGATLRGARTTLTVRGGERYNSMNWSAQLTYLFSQRTRLTAGYSEEVTTTLRILQDELGGGEPGGPIVDPGGFSLIDSAFKRNRTFVTLSGSRGRSTFSMNGFYEERRPETISPDQDRYGGRGTLTRRLSYNLSTYVSAGYEKTDEKGLAPRDDDFYSGQVGFNYTLSQYVSGGISYIFTKRDSDDPSRDLKENAVKINIRATF